MQQQTYLNAQEKQYEAMGDTANAPKSVDTQLEAARAELADLQARYTDDHPDIKKLKETIAGLEKLKQNMGEEAKEKIETNTASAEQVQALTPMVQLQGQMKVNKMELQTSAEQIQRLEQSAQMYQARLNATPAVEAEMSDMMRDFGNMKEEYADLLAKKQESSLATNLENQQQGAQFRVIDPPSLPDKPAFPDRFKFSLAAIGCRLGYWRCFLASAQNFSTIVSATSKLSAKLLVCRYWSRFLLCRRRGKFAPPAGGRGWQRRPP